MHPISEISRKQIRMNCYEDIISTCHEGCVIDLFVELMQK
jgi:hypothetical protein